MTQATRPAFTSMVEPDATGEELSGQKPMLDAITEAHTRTIDVLNGYETMMSKAEPAFRPTAEAFRDLHHKHAGQLANILIAQSRDPEDDGSFMGTVNQAVVTARSWFDDIDEDVTKQIRSGERHVLDGFDEAIAAAANTQIETEIAAMRAELANLLEGSRAPNSDA